MRRGLMRAVLAASLLTAGSALGGFLGFTASAGAASTYGPTACTPMVSVSPTTVNVGNSITVTLTGTCTSDSLTVALHSDAVTLGTITTDAAGSGQGTFTIPCGTADGTHTVSATDSRGNTGSATLTVTGQCAAAPSAAPPATSTSGLAFTGSDIAAVTGVGALAIVGGGMFVLATRRRRRRDSFG